MSNAEKALYLGEIVKRYDKELKNMSAEDLLLLEALRINRESDSEEMTHSIQILLSQMIK